MVRGSHPLRPLDLRLRMGRVLGVVLLAHPLGVTQHSVRHRSPPTSNARLAGFDVELSVGLPPEDVPEEPHRERDPSGAEDPAAGAGVNLEPCPGRSDRVSPALRLIKAAPSKIAKSSTGVAA